MNTFVIQFVDGGPSISCTEGRSLLAAIEQSSAKSIPIGCRGGGCGVCRVRIVKGDYSVRRMSTKHVSEEQAQLGVVLACQVFPSSDLLVDTATTQSKTGVESNCL